MMRTLGAVAISAALLAGCAGKATGPDRVKATPPSFSTTTQLLGANGELRGTAALTQTDAGTRVVARVEGLAPGTYAIHLHENGKCEAPEFKTAGAHFNPNSHQHGSMNPAGPHMGDLPNITIAASGSGEVDATIAGLMLVGGATPLLDADGAAVIVHAGPDDYKTDPSGNSGARIACGAVRRP